MKPAGGDSHVLPAERGGARRAVLKICAMATSVCDKMVSLVYERALHDETSATWIARCETQVGAVFDALETARAARSSLFWFGDLLTHTDIAVTCAMRFVAEAHAALDPAAKWPGSAIRRRPSNAHSTRPAWPTASPS